MPPAASRICCYNKSYQCVCARVLVRASDGIFAFVNARPLLAELPVSPLQTWSVESATASLLNTFPVSGRPAGAQESAEVEDDAAGSSASSCSLPPFLTSLLRAALLCDVQSARPSPPAFLLRQKAAHCAPKSRDPPPYEDAVKQKRSMLTAVQVRKQV